MASASYHVGEVTVTLNIDSGRASKREGCFEKNIARVTFAFKSLFSLIFHLFFSLIDHLD